MRKQKLKGQLTQMDIVNKLCSRASLLVVRTRFDASERRPVDVTSWTQRHAKELHLETCLFWCLIRSYIHALLPTHSALLYLLWEVMPKGFNRFIQVLVSFWMWAQSSSWLGFFECSFVSLMRAKLAESHNHTNHTSTLEGVRADMCNLRNYVYMINIGLNGFHTLEMIQKVRRRLTLHHLWVQICTSYTHSFKNTLNLNQVFLWLTHLQEAL